ncbi:MAG: hypothetical protein ABJO86_14300 [Lentilitoribacter sp.]
MFNLNWGHVEGIETVLTLPMEEQELVISAYGKGRQPQGLFPNDHLTRALKDYTSFIKNTLANGLQRMILYSVITKANA